MGVMADGRWPEVGKLYAEMNLDCAIRIGKVWRFRKIIVLNFRK